MSTVRDDLVPAVDDARAIVDGMGLRRRAVGVVSRTYTGEGITMVPTDTVLLISPRPKIDTVSTRQAAADAMLNVGDLCISKISATYTRADIDPAASGTTESFYRINDLDGLGAGDYRVVKGPLPLSFGWTVWVRSMNRAAAPLAVDP